MKKTEDFLKILEEKQKEIRHKYHADVKGIFGSVARGEQTAESDIDILADFDEKADFFDYIGLGLFLEEVLGCRVDIVSQKSLREEIKTDILREAVYI